MSTLLVSRMLRPNKPNVEKNTIYESGESPAHDAMGPFNIRFYIIALVFVLFEAELIFLVPWALIFKDADLMEATNGSWGWLTMTEAFIFLAILTIGLAYVWAQGLLDWIKPSTHTTIYKSKIPKSAYERYT